MMRALRDRELLCYAAFWIVLAALVFGVSFMIGRWSDAAFGHAWTERVSLAVTVLAVRYEWRRK